MKVIIFGANGGTGRELVKQSLKKGYETSVFIHKNTSSIAPVIDRLTVFNGSVMDYKSVYDAIYSHDVVLVALGTRPGVPNAVLSVGTENIIRAMKDTKVMRLVVETGAGLIEDRSKLPVLWRLFSNVPFMKDMFNAKREQEKLVKDSGLDWVIVRPANLTNGPLTKKYLSGEYLSLKADSTISRANVAHFMLNQVENDRHLHESIIVSQV